jgi:hypothetical protein
MQQVSSGGWRLSNFGRTLRRLLLGEPFDRKDTLSRFPGRDVNGNRTVTTQQERQQSEQGNGGGKSSEPEYEPVFGLPRRSIEEWLARNPDYRAIYEAELRKRS